MFLLFQQVRHPSPYHTPTITIFRNMDSLRSLRRPTVRRHRHLCATSHPRRSLQSSVLAPHGSIFYRHRAHLQRLRGNHRLIHSHIQHENCFSSIRAEFLRFVSHDVCIGVHEFVSTSLLAFLLLFECVVLHVVGCCGWWVSVYWVVCGV